MLNIVLYSLTALYLMFLLLTACLLLFIKVRKKGFLDLACHRLLIIAPHPDDCVGMGGGSAIQILKRNGEVDVAYTVPGNSQDKAVRKQEAIDAWATIGLGESHLHFLFYEKIMDFVTPEQIKKGINALQVFIEKMKPDVVIIPHYEGGHYQHDVTNYMVYQAVNRIGQTMQVFEAPLYNFYFSLKTTPEKILSGMIRFIPFCRYPYPPEPVSSEPLFFLNMAIDELNLKKEMLSRFKTQNPDQLVERFGFADRFLNSFHHDYTRPPFDYKGSFAQRIDRFKSKPILGKLARSAMKWTRTIHPDPNYTMTHIPIPK